MIAVMISLVKTITLFTLPAGALLFFCGKKLSARQQILLLVALLSINLALLLFIGSRMQLHYTRRFYSRNLQRYGELLERVDTTEALALTRAFHSDPMHPIPNESPTQPQ